MFSHASIHRSSSSSSTYRPGCHPTPLASPPSPAHCSFSAMSHAQTPSPSSLPDQHTRLPMPPPSKLSTKPPPLTTQIPLDTPPSSIRSLSPNPPRPTSKTTPTGPNHPTANTFPSAPNQQPGPNRTSVVFPAAKPADTTPTPPSTDNATPRPRYHSSVSRSQIVRSETTSSFSGSSFAGKLKSLRKKIENELSRKRNSGPASNQVAAGAGGKRGSKKAQKGTVAGLRPSPALTVPEGMSVADASQLCAAKRTDCVLVVDEEEGLSGIFTAKDLAFRVSLLLPMNVSYPAESFRSLPKGLILETRSWRKS